MTMDTVQFVEALTFGKVFRGFRERIFQLFARFFITFIRVRERIHVLCFPAGYGTSNGFYQVLALG
jgi:hypothetical protein